MDKGILALEKINSFIYKIQKIFFVTVVSFVVIIDMAQVLGRYIFKYSIPRSDQVSLLIFCIIIMLGGNIAIKERSEIKVTLIRFKSERAQQKWEIICDLISICTILFFIVSTWMLIRQASTYTKVVSSIQLDYKYIYMIVLAGFVLMFLEKVLMLLERIRFLVKGQFRVQEKGGTQI